MSTILNENNIQSPFQYKISEDTFELLNRNGELELNTDNVQVKVFSGQRLFCADIGYAVDGPLENMEFLIDDIKVYPILLEELEDLQTVEIKDNEIYLIKEDINFKSIIFFPPSDLNKNFKFNITTYSSTFSSFMFDEIAKKLNSLDTNYPIKNYYENTDYKVNDIIKYNGYLYRVFKEFTSDSTDYYLETNCNILTPFKKLELDTDYKANELIEYANNFFIVQQDFLYNQASGTLTNLNGLLKPLQDIIVWFDGIAKIYKNQIIIKDNISYIVLEDIENPVWGSIQNKIDYFCKAENIFYDDTNSGFGNNTNTVQKVIEKLKSDKQDRLTAGNNIDLNGNNISVIGGTNKEYTLDTSYFINDLIVREEKIYKVNENFTATDWSTDRAKLTLISSGGSEGATEAIDVSYDNSKTNLEYLSGYDFPKFKTPIPDTINLILILNNGTEIPATITKQPDGSIIFNASFNEKPERSGNIIFAIKSIDSDTNIYKIYSVFAQFFNIEIFSGGDIKQLNYFNLEPTECVISEISDPLKLLVILLNTDVDNPYISFLITKQDNTEIPINNYNITLNVKNRVLRNQDSNLSLIANALTTIENLSFEAINNTIKLVGEYRASNIGFLHGGYFYSNIIENYFNMSNDLLPTSGITSSSGKEVKFTISKPSETAYILAIGYQDGSNIQEGDVFTFNLTPDKNYTLDPIYSPVANVQELGEALNEKIKSTSNEIKINEEFDTGKTLNGKKVYCIICKYSNSLIDLSIDNVVYIDLNNIKGHIFIMGLGRSGREFHKIDISNGSIRGSSNLSSLLEGETVSGIIEYTKD